MYYYYAAYGWGMKDGCMYVMYVRSVFIQQKNYLYISWKFPFIELLYKLSCGRICLLYLCISVDVFVALNSFAWMRYKQDVCLILLAAGKSFFYYNFVYSTILNVDPWAYRLCL